MPPAGCGSSNRYCPKPAAVSSSRQNRSLAAWLSASCRRTAAALAARLAASAGVQEPAQDSDEGRSKRLGEPHCQAFRPRTDVLMQQHSLQCPSEYTLGAHTCCHKLVSIGGACQPTGAPLLMGARQSRAAVQYVWKNQVRGHCHVPAATTSSASAAPASQSGCSSGWVPVSTARPLPAVTTSAAMPLSPHP